MDGFIFEDDETHTESQQLFWLVHALSRVSSPFLYFLTAQSWGINLGPSRSADPLPCLPPSIQWHMAYLPHAASIQIRLKTLGLVGSSKKLELGHQGIGEKSR